jgi:ferrochelatase
MNHLPANHPSVQTPKTGVLLINLGTPDATDYWSMRRYLKEFLSDRRVIDINPFIWQIILNVFVLTRRPFKSGHAYDTIWNRELDESPLRTITRSQTEKTIERLNDNNIVCDWAMRYGNPSIASGIDRLRAKGCQRILLYALYPQYCAATSATVYDKAFSHLKTLNWQPAIRTVPTYHDDAVYIGAIGRSIQNHLKTLSWQPEKILMSFHGVPERYLLEGDPYHCFCQKTSRLVQEYLKYPGDQWQITFQSRFGPEKWLQPYTADKVIELAKKGIKNIAVIAPGFVADCLETLEELNIALRESFLEHGGQNFTYIPCLNDGVPGIDVIHHIVQKELRGWA